MASRYPLLLVDGYNVIYGTLPYKDLIDEHAGAGALADVAMLSRDPYGHDPFDRARETLITDVAAYAQGSYDPVIVFDAAGNLSEERPDFSRAGVRVVFSKTGESADSVIERLATRARRQNRDVLLVTSDNTIRFTVGGVPITTVSSQLLARDIQLVNTEIESSRQERSSSHMTLADRLSPGQREKLNKLLGL